MYSSDDQKTLFNQSKSILKKNKDLNASDIPILRTLIEFHEWKYYVQNDPVLSDFEYDQLYKQLESLEATYPDLIIPESPTQRIGRDLTEDFPTVDHYTPMLSLNNSYNREDLEDFDRQIKKLCDLAEDVDVDYCVEPKFDGGSIALVYEDDQLIRGATRGNGESGDDVTNNVKVMRSIPLRAIFSERKIKKAELRGEVLIRKDHFKRINEVRAEEGLDLLANPRNSAAGGLRVKDPREVVRRKLTAYIYQLGFAIDAGGNNLLDGFDRHSDQLNYLYQIGFKTPEKEKKVCKNIGEVLQYCQEWEAKREVYAYEIDGMVIKVDQLHLQKLCGYTSHHPRWAIAYKFKAKQATTRLVNVEYQVGKIGSITPVAKVQPVALAGVTVSSISLHNEDFIRSKDIRLGDHLLIERAGDVIPYIVKPLADLRDGSERPIDFPKFCPSNSKEKVALIREENEAAWRCPNCTCGEQDKQRIIFHVSKNAMDIDGFGKAYVDRFHELGWIGSIDDVYNLDYEKIAELEGFGEKSALKLKASVDLAKNNPIHKLMHSLSIHHLGKKASKILAERIDHVLDLADWTMDDFTRIKDIGPVVAVNVMEYFHRSSNIDMLKQMEAYGVNLKQTEADKPIVVKADAPLSGKSILFTGTLSKMTRKEAQEMATIAGAKNISAVSKNLDILVAGARAGSKLKKAEALGTVTIYNEEEFLKLFE